MSRADSDVLCPSRSSVMSQEILSVDVSAAEDGFRRVALCRSLIVRRPVRSTSDAHAGLVAALGAAPPGAGAALHTHNTGRHPDGVVAVGTQPVAFRVRSNSPDSLVDQRYRIIDALTDKLPKVADYVGGA